MKLWTKINGTWQKVILIGGIAGILSGGTVTVNSVIRWGKAVADAPQKLQLLEKRIDSLEIGQYTLEQTVKGLNNFLEVASSILRSNSDPIKGSYYIVFEDGIKRKCDLRKGDSGDVYAFIEGLYLFSAIWSNTEQRYFIIDFHGNEHIIYE